MRSGDVGPFGVAAIVLVLLVQVTALADTTAQGVGVETLIVATVVGRLCAMVACVRGVPAARGDGLGATVAGSVPRMPAAAAAAVVTTTAVILGAVGGDSAGPRAALTFGSSVAGGLGVTIALIALARKRFGGITGDVLGAVVELAFVAALLVLATYHR
jgi:adenosylcobinamide-GDP ribazoletransferase